METNHTSKFFSTSYNPKKVIGRAKSKIYASKNWKKQWKPEETNTSLKLKLPIWIYKPGKYTAYQTLSSLGSLEGTDRSRTQNFGCSLPEGTWGTRRGTPSRSRAQNNTYWGRGGFQRSRVCSSWNGFFLIFSVIRFQNVSRVSFEAYCKLCFIS